MADRDFDKFDPIIPERDDPIPGAARSARAQSPKAETPARAKSGGGGKGLVLFLLLALIAVSVFGWMQIDKLNRELSTLEQRFSGLENDLSSQSGSLSETGAALNKRIKEMSETQDMHMSEIRKLWGVANDTNKKAIAANKDLLTKQAATDKKLAADLAALNSSIKAFQDNFLGINVEQDYVKQELQSLVDKLNTQQQELNRMVKQVGTNKEAIAAIDAYRRQVNQQLQRLEQLVQSGTALP